MAAWANHAEPQSSLRRVIPEHTSRSLLKQLVSALQSICTIVTDTSVSDPDPANLVDPDPDPDPGLKKLLKN